MSDDQTFSDEQLTAFLDGETDHIPAEEIRAALKTDAGLRARLDELSLETGQIAGAFDRLLERAPDMPEFDAGDETVAPARRGLPLRQLAASVAVALFVGATAGYFIRGDSLQTWHDYVAAYHALYIDDTLGTVERPDGALTAELNRVGDAIGKTIELPVLRGIDGLAYKRGQLLGFENRPLVQLAFLSDKGVPIALCIIRSGDGGDKELQVSELQGMSAASWTAGGYDYLLIGGTDPGLITSVASGLVGRI